ncbi:MAG: thiamine pyrophosphate-dependent enzyme, partial [Candidatus Aenigmatarchaeota archaeon]
ETKLSTGAETTWCPGCYNFMLLNSVKSAIKDVMKEEGVGQEEFAMAAGIGCHGKMFDYLNLGGVYSLHGRTIPTCVGMKLANPNLKVLGFGGDGDTYAEGISHFIHAARYNVDMTMVVHNNQVFALTTGQGTPTSERGYKSKAQPHGVVHKPLNPLKMAIDAGATFVARAYPKDMKQTEEILKRAIEHKGFSLVDVVLPCLAYHEDREFLEENMYDLENHDETDRKAAWEKASEWDYNIDNEKIPVGILYRVKEKTLEEKFPQLQELQEESKGWFQVDR